MPKFPLNGIILTADISLLPLIFSYLLLINDWQLIYLCWLALQETYFLWYILIASFDSLPAGRWASYGATNDWHGFSHLQLKPLSGNGMWVFPPFPFSFQPQMLQVRNVALPFHTFCYSALLKTLMEAPKLISSLRSIANDMLVGFFP